MRARWYVILALGFIGICPAVSQTDSIRHQLHLITRYSDDGVYLRWSIDDAARWYVLNQQGYELSRWELDSDGRPLESSRQTWDVSPLNEEKFRRRCEENEDNKNLWIAANSLYGESPIQEGDPVLFSRFTEMENTFTYAMLAADLDFLTATSLGLGMLDHSVEKNKSYFYKVVPKSAEQRKEIFSMGCLCDTKIEEDIRPEISTILEEEGHLLIQWDRFFHEKHFSAYWIERKEKDGSFVRVNISPFLGGQTDDFSTQVFSYRMEVKNYHPAHYRIRGVTPFGTLSEPSTAVLAQARDRTPPSSVTSIHTEYVERNVVQISWKKVGEASKYQIWHSLEPNGSLGVIDEVEQGEVPRFEHHISPEQLSHYYRIAAFDTAGNYSLSHFSAVTYEDSIAPAAPTGLVGQIDTNGVVRLKWSLGEDADLKGYYVHFSNKSSHTFTNITPMHLRDTLYIDTITLNTLTEEIFYRVVAIDFNNNYSASSEVLMLKRPDMIAPYPPVFYDKIHDEDYVHLSWHPSPSKDVVHYHLYRRTLGGEWEWLSTMDVQTLEYTDKEAAKGEKYEYRIIAEDDAGLKSKSAFDYGMTHVNKSRLPSTLIKSVDFEDEPGRVVLHIDASEELKHIVYREKKEGQYEIIGYMDFEQTEYHDYQVMRGQRYKYCLTTRHRDGRRSNRGEVSSIEIKVE